MKYKSTQGQMRKYRRSFRKWNRDFEKATEAWIKREGEKGKGGKWDYTKREYTVLTKPVKPPEPTPADFGLTDEYVVKELCPQLREQALK